MRFLVYLYVISVIACGLFRLIRLSYAAVKMRIKRSTAVHNSENAHIIQ